MLTLFVYIVRIKVTIPGAIFGRGERRDFMSANLSATPLLLLDNSSMMSVVNQGDFKCTNLSFDEARAILDMHGENDILKCFDNGDLERIIFDYLGMERREYPYKHIRNMRPGQDGIVFKLYVTPSETQPVIRTEDGVEAKKIQNIYIYCQFITRLPE